MTRATSESRYDATGTYLRFLIRGSGAVIAIGSIHFVAALFGRPLLLGWPGLFLSFLLPFLGALLISIARYGGTTPGIKNNGTVTAQKGWRGISGWVVAAVLITFYICLYWFPDLLSGAIALTDPLSLLITGKPADQWFFYGFLYTYAVVTMGIRFAFRYRHNRYEQIRNGSVIGFQLVLAFLIPGFLKALNQPEFYFTYFWPLKPNYLYPGNWDWLSAHPGGLGVAFFFWATVMSFVAVPVLTYFLGKRWYCSWVCGCGGLAETLGDPYRHLSDKSLKAWKFERWSIHTVLVIIVLGTVLLWVEAGTETRILGDSASRFNKWYGFIVGSVLAGVVGTGFYSLFGNRVWCRFFCPQAAILGIFQRFYSRFRITTNGDQCMSCGNCSKYCEMGIDVRFYAQKSQSIVRASCVGCGICSAVCPRGVLKLENGKTHKDRYEGAENPLGALKRSILWRG